MKNYTMIRGQIAEQRCNNKSEWGSPLYCNCGCQIPRESDPTLDLSDVIISRKSNEGYANFILSRNGKDCGGYNSQYSTICIDGNEYLGVDHKTVAHLDIGSCRKPETININPGTIVEESGMIERLQEQIAETEQDAVHKDHPGYCTKCHSYCYGDCEAN